MAVIACSLSAGCLTADGGNGGQPTTEPDHGGSPATPGSGTSVPPSNDCDPADVSRPPIVRDANHSPLGYGTKPQELTGQSVADYLADFETAYAWNRILDKYAPVVSLNINTTTPWTPEKNDDGFLASSRIETEYTKEVGDDPVTRVYVASYYVSPSPVYRVETESESVDPRTHPDWELVQCGSDDTK